MIKIENGTKRGILACRVLTHVYPYIRVHLDSYSRTSAQTRVNLCTVTQILAATRLVKSENQTDRRLIIALEVEQTRASQPRAFWQSHKTTRQTCAITRCVFTHKHSDGVKSCRTIFNANLREANAETFRRASDRVTQRINMRLRARKATLRCIFNTLLAHD